MHDLIDAGKLEHCSVKDIIIKALAHGASIDDIWRWRCRTCSNSDNCTFYDSDEYQETEQRRKVETMNTSFRIYAAAAILVWFLFVISGYLVLDAIAKIHHWDYHLEGWFIDDFKLVITSGLVVLTSSALAVRQHKRLRLGSKPSVDNERQISPPEA